MQIKYNNLFVYRFRSKYLLDGWSIHPSIKRNQLFEHLEFLGDRILGLYISKYLFYKSYNLKKKSVYMSYYCSAEVMGHIAKPLQKYLTYSGQINATILTDTLEAFLAAVYLDGGPVEQIIHSMWQDVFKKHIQENPKNLLQEHPKIKPKIVNYQFQKYKDGFLCTINMPHFIYQAKAFGSSKKIASMKSAHKMLKYIK